MAKVIGTGQIQTLEPEIKHTEDGKLKPIGHCWVKGDELECYGWHDEQILIILDKHPASDDGIPEDQYYCFNPTDGGGWVLRSQITFKLDSLLGDDPWILPEV